MEVRRQIVTRWNLRINVELDRWSVAGNDHRDAGGRGDDSAAAARGCVVSTPGLPTRPLRAVAEVALGRMRSPDRAEGPNMVPYLRAANVKDGSLDLSDVKSMDFNPSEQSTYGLRSGDVLVTEGAGSIAAVGASAVWTGEIEGVVCFQNTLLRLRPRGDTSARYLMWWARHAYGSGLLASVAKGANIYHLGADNVRLLPVSIPAPSVQRAIAAYLDAETARIDALIGVRRRTRDLLEDRRRVLVDQGLRPVDDLDWEELPVKRMLRGVEQGWSPQCESRPADSDEWGVLKAGAANGGTFRPTENKALPVDVEPLVEYEIMAGDLLVSRANTRELVASVCVVPEVRPRLLLCDKLFRLTPGPDIEPRYLAYALSTSNARRSIEAEATGSSDSMQNIGQDTIRELQIWAPRGRPAQALVADRLDQQLADSRKLDDSMRRQVDLLLERRQALITAAVTGQLEIPGVAA